MLTRPFYADFGAKQALFGLSAHRDLFMLIRPLYAYKRKHSLLCLSGFFMLARRRVRRNHAYQCGKKNEMDLPTVKTGD